jgi:cell division protein FtsQ
VICLKRRFSRFRFYFINIFLGIVIFAVAAVILIYFFCKTDEVTMEGTDIYAKEDMEAYVLSDKYSDNAVYAVLINTFHPPRDIPFVEKVTVRLTSYHSIDILVQEKDMIGYIALTEGNYAYFDEDGNVVEISERVLSDKIPISGVLVESAEVGQKVALEEKQLSFLTALLKALNKYDIPVAAGAFDEAGNLSVAYNNIWISVGDQTYLEEKIMRLPHILPQLEGQSGTLHLENWSEDNTDIVFEKQT